MKTKELIAEANSLPVEERALVVDSLLKSMNPPQSDIDKKWIQLAKIRLEEIKSGQVTKVSDEEIFIVAIMNLLREPQYWKDRLK